MAEPNPKRRVHRLTDIALVHVAEYVGRQISNLVQRTDIDSDELLRIADDIKMNYCICVPIAMYDEFSEIVLRTITTILSTIDISADFLYLILESPLMTIIDQLTDIKRNPDLLSDLTIVLWTNLHKLKMLRNLEIYHAETLRKLNIKPQREDHVYGGPLSWLEHCDLQFIENFVCPTWFFRKNTAVASESHARLQILTVHDTDKVHSMTSIFDAIARICRLKEVDLHRCRDMSRSAVQHLLSKNQYLARLGLFCNLKVFSFWKKIYPVLKHLQVLSSSDLNSADLRIVATRFPSSNFLDENSVFSKFRPLKFAAFPNLSSLSFSKSFLPLEDVLSLLTEIGPNIVSLQLPFTLPISRNDLYFIHQNCINCENLDIMFAPFSEVEPLIVPPFSKLKHLDLKMSYPSSNERRLDYPLDFTQMPCLECLRYSNFQINQARLEFMLLDSQNFPCLAEIIPRYVGWDQVEYIRGIIKQHNLDVIFTPILDRPPSRLRVLQEMNV